MGRVCGSGCPYYGVDEDYNGYCAIDGNSYRERFSDCNMGYGDGSGSSSSSSSGSSATDLNGCGCFKWLIIVAIVLGLFYGVLHFFVLDNGLVEKKPETSQSQVQGQVAYTTAEINLRQGPSTNDAKILVMPDNARVVIQRQEGAWSYVEYNDQLGWCKTEYLRME